MPVSTKTGESQAVALAPQLAVKPQSVFLTADVADATAAINLADKSYKQGGATIVVDTAGAFEIYVAQGADATDAWISTDGVTTITPA